MPKPGHSCEDTQNLEDDTAELLDGEEYADWLRAFGLLLHQRGAITDETYRHYRRACKGVERSIEIGRRNTARLRRVAH